MLTFCCNYKCKICWGLNLTFHINVLTFRSVLNRFVRTKPEQLASTVARECQLNLGLNLDWLVLTPLNFGYSLQGTFFTNI